MKKRDVDIEDVGCEAERRTHVVVLAYDQIG